MSDELSPNNVVKIISSTGFSDQYDLKDTLDPEMVELRAKIARRDKYFALGMEYAQDAVKQGKNLMDRLVFAEYIKPLQPIEANDFHWVARGWITVWDRTTKRKLDNLELDEIQEGYLELGTITAQSFHGLMSTIEILTNELTSARERFDNAMVGLHAYLDEIEGNGHS